MAGTLNITGYTPDEAENPFDGSANKHTVVATSGGVFNFNPAITVAGQANADFLSASAFVDGSDIVAETRLRWYSTDPNREAHGTFTIADGQIFTLGAALSRQFRFDQPRNRLGRQFAHQNRRRNPDPRRHQHLFRRHHRCRRHAEGDRNA